MESEPGIMSVGIHIQVYKIHIDFSMGNFMVADADLLHFGVTYSLRPIKNKSSTGCDIS